MVRATVIAGFLLTLAASCLAQEHSHENGEKLGTVHFATSCNEAAQKDFNRAVALLHSFQFSRAIEGFNFVSAFFFALVYAGLEDRDKAFKWLEKACEERFNRLAYANVEALWDPLRSDPRFAELIRRIGIPT